MIEAVREGYLLHYGEPRLLAGADADLALLAGDYLYALGLERLAALGDLEAVRELADLIASRAQLHAEGGGRAADGAVAGVRGGRGRGPPPASTRRPRRRCARADPARPQSCGRRPSRRPTRRG